MDTIFSLSSLIVMPFWLLLIFFPNWSWTRRIVRSPWIAAPAALLYLVLVLPQLGAVFPAVINPSLGAVAALLGTPDGATIGWAHFLAFDLFVGRWIYWDNQTVGLSSWIMAPILFLTLMVGPAGFLFYLGAKTAVLRTAFGDSHGHDHNSGQTAV